MPIPQAAHYMSCPLPVDYSNFPIPCPEYLKGLFPVPGWTGSGRLLHAAVSGNRSAAISQMISDQAPAPALMVQLECSAAELCQGKCHNGNVFWFS